VVVLSVSNSTTAASTDIVLEANLVYAPILERAILERWNTTWGGNYTLNDTHIELLVNFNDASIELAQLQGNGIDVLGDLGSIYFGITNRSNLLSYVWPGYNANSVRYGHICLSVNVACSFGDRIAAGGGTACSTAWGFFDSIHVNSSALDLLQFIEEDGKLGVTYAPLNLTAWKD
jgi:hypothetical protein